MSKPKSSEEEKYCCGNFYITIHLICGKKKKKRQPTVKEKAILPKYETR